MNVVVADTDFVKLNPEFKVQWLAALRSGDYQQGAARMRRRRGGVDRFCCLGVAADLCGTQWYDYHGQDNDLDFWINKDWGLQANLPDPIMNKMSLDNRAKEELVQMNDSGKTFLEIADWIETNL